MRVVFILHFWCAFAIGLSAQPKLSVSSTKALIGDKLTLQIEVPHVTGSEWVNTDVIPADTVDAIQMLDQSDVQVHPKDNASIKQWTIAVYDTGFIRVPPIAVVMQNARGNDTFWTNDIPLLIEGVVDSTGMAPLKPIHYEPVKFSDYLPYILGFLLIVGLVLGVIWRQRRPKHQKEVIVPEEIIPAHEIALEQLRALEERKLWQEGKIKEYHLLLSRILRTYLEERYGVAALESTTGEVRQMLKPLLSKEHFEDMMPMMEIEDLIKFAKAQPPVEVHERHLDFVRKFVINTKQEPVNEEANV